MNVIRVDTREPEEMYRLVQKIASEYDLEIKREQLEVSDYCYGEVGVERKELDMINIRDVLTKADELKSNFEYPFVMISMDLTMLQSLHRNRQQVNSLPGLIASLSARGVSPIFCSDRENMVKVMIKTFLKITDDKIRDKKEPIRPQPTSEDWKIHVVSSLPHIGKDRAKLLLNHFGTVRSIINASKEELCEVDGIGDKLSDEIVNVVNEGSDKI